MSVKFKLGFTVSAETLFGLLSKMLPIEDLSVEEVLSGVETTPRLAPTQRPAIAKPVRARRRGQELNLKEGINGVLVRALENGPLRSSELRSFLTKAGFSANSTSSRLEHLKKHQIVVNNDGVWRLKESV